MNKILIFAGTTEGRRLAERLSGASVRTSVCVATEYGETLLPKGETITHLTGRLDEKQMESLMAAEGFSCVVDATHPYAVEVSANIREAAEKIGMPYFRLLREETTGEYGENTVFVDSVKAAAEYLKTTDGNILASTGSKELKEYTEIKDYRKRVFARVLSTEESVCASRSLGFEGRNLICMQGPFSEELNYALMKEYNIRYLVTKSSGKAGGFDEKLRAAERAGAAVVIVGRPEEHQGYSYEQVLGLLEKMEILPSCVAEKEAPDEGGFQMKRREAVLVSIGTGAFSQMTEAAKEAFDKCDAVIGAERMLQALGTFRKPSFVSYKNEEMISWMEEHPEYRNIAVAFSGDLGFYSGAKKLLPLLEEKGYLARCIPGMSSLIYFAARLGISWDDAKLMSIHGRFENLIQSVRENRKVFALLGGKDSVGKLCKELLYYGFSDVGLTVGEELSYKEERIRRGTPEMLLSEEFHPLAVAFIENPKAAGHVVTHGLEDDAFIRGKVPMTKCEIRAVSISRMRLCRDSVIYDIGAGTGSVSVEAALQAADGRVYAVEKNPEAVALLRENKQKFGVPNLEIIEGEAPEALEALPAPTHAFIGGSSGNLRPIVELLFRKNPGIRIVINAIALETVAEAVSLMKTYAAEDGEISQVMVSRAKKLGEHQLMMGQNPVYIVSLTGKGEI
ncbi:precorrin-6A reductase [Qiania dongpingensis]|uniref:Precorrin-6A reductase n=1 Tax=Qiania dongpingensis TaxID=2763669 RepID=A0A7G9G4C4_9FIRM|nr:precorrin-6A reductase [Qiania dongpingensis]QNM05656.1 precorrin-6A reductase [Qiania dongpingensis]